MVNTSNMHYLHKIKCFRCVKVKKYIRTGITIFKYFIWGDIASYIRSEIMFYGSVDASPYNKISDRISDDIPPQIKKLNTVIP